MDKKHVNFNIKLTIAECNVMCGAEKPTIPPRDDSFSDGHQHRKKPL